MGKILLRWTKELELIFLLIFDYNILYFIIIYIQRTEEDFYSIQNQL